MPNKLPLLHTPLRPQSNATMATRWFKVPTKAWRSTRQERFAINARRRCQLPMLGSFHQEKRDLAILFVGRVRLAITICATPATNL